VNPFDIFPIVDGGIRNILEEEEKEKTQQG
jgi:hypothetical protein